MRSTITGILALLAIALLSAGAFAASDPVEIKPVEKTPLSIPGADTKGHSLTIVHFWAVWCTPCLAELPELDAFTGMYKDMDIRVVAISMDIDIVKVRLFFDEKGIRNLTPLLDQSNAGFLASKLRGLPGTLFFDKEGKLVARADGPVDWGSTATITAIEKLILGESS